MPPSEPLIHWPEPIMQLIGFIAAFFATGAVGFRWFVLTPLRTGHIVDAEERTLIARATARAAAFGLAGAAVTFALFAQSVPEMAARRHQTVSQALSAPATALQLILLGCALLGFTLALGRVRFGWVLAAIGVIVNPFRPALFGQWTRIVNPVHVLAGGMWIGTLFVLVTCGLAMILAARIDPARRGALAARMVHAFSPLALTSAAVLATMGLITAWTHLKRLDALWTTPYGIALIVKLCLVGCVVALGAFNWRRQRPRLGTDAAARDLRRSASGELTVAGLVLIVTSILVSLPSPR